MHLLQLVQSFQLETRVQVHVAKPQLKLMAALDKGRELKHSNAFVHFAYLSPGCYSMRLTFPRAVKVLKNVI